MSASPQYRSGKKFISITVQLMIVSHFQMLYMAAHVPKCHEGDCVSCSLCHKGNTKFIHPSHIRIKAFPVYKWLKYHKYQRQPDHK